MSVKPTAADLHRLRDVATKLEQLAEIVTRSQFTTDHDVAEQLYREFWIIQDDLTALEKRLLIPISVGFQTVPDAIHEAVRALASFTNGVISIANGPDQTRSQFFGPRGRIPLWEVSKIPTGGAAIAEQFEKIDAKRRQDWQSLSRMIESLVAEQRCRDACDAVRTFNTQLTADNPASVAAKPQVDGPFKPDGFCLNGAKVEGLAEDWQKVLTFVWERSSDPPKWSDVATHLGVENQMTDGEFAKLIYRINQKIKKTWPETLQTVKGLVVLRKPIRGANGSSRSTAKTPLAKKPAGNATHKSTKKAVKTPRPNRKTGARKK